MRDFLEVTRRGRPREAISAAARTSPTGWRIGSPNACDGYVIAGTHTPGTFEDFVRFVVPEFQRRGLYRNEYKGATLRENLGLPVPQRDAWRLPVAPNNAYCAKNISVST